MTGPATAPVAPVEVLGTGRRRPPQDRLHAKNELGRRERLGQVVVGAILEPGDAIDRGAPSRQHEDRRVGRLLIAAHGADDGPPVQFGEHQVEHDERRLVRLDGLERRRPIRGGHDREAVPLQVRPHEPDDLRVIVDDEDRRSRDGRVSRRSGHREHGRPSLRAPPCRSSDAEMRDGTK